NFGRGGRRSFGRGKPVLAYPPVRDDSNPSPQVCGPGASSPNYSNPSTARPPPRCIRPFLTELRPGPTSEANRPLTPTCGRPSNGLFRGSTGEVRNGNREGGTHALAHAAIPLQVWPARGQPHHDPPRPDDYFRRHLDE